MTRRKTQNIIDQLEEIHSGKPWMGPNYKKRLERIKEENCFVRPLPELHSVAEILSHLTFWRKEANMKIKTGNGSQTDDAEGNWLSIEKLQKMGWDKIKTEYLQSLKEQIDLLSEREDKFLNETYFDPDFKGHFTYQWLLDGMIQHDAYHLGQLGIILKLLYQK